MKTLPRIFALILVTTLLGSLAHASEAPLDVRLSDMISGAVSQGSLLLAVAIAFFAGIVVSLSPCVYPLIPITIAIFGARESQSYLKGFLLSLSYVVGMALFYSAIAVVFSLLGLASSALMAIPAVVLAIAGVGLLMAASLFGAFELVLPSSLQTKLSDIGGAGYRGAFLMGLVAGIIAAPCAGPVLIFILALITKEGNLVLGISLMISYAFGIGLLFLILGTFSQLISKMPKSGPWMETARSVLGLGMLIASLYIAAPHLPLLSDLFTAHISTTVGIVSLLLAAAGIPLGALHLPLRHGGTVTTLRKLVGILLCTAGILGGVAYLDSGPARTQPSQLVWLDDHDQALAQAAAQKKPVMIDFGAEWCHACKELEKKTFTDPLVEKELQRFVLVRVDCTKLTDDITALWEKYGITGLPNIVFIDAAGKTLESPRVTTFLEPKLFVEQISKVR